MSTAPAATQLGGAAPAYTKAGSSSSSVTSLLPPSYTETLGTPGSRRSLEESFNTFVKQSLQRGSKKSSRRKHVAIDESLAVLSMNGTENAARSRATQLPEKEAELTLHLADNFCFVYPNANGRPTRDSAQFGEGYQTSDEAESSYSARQNAFFVVSVKLALPVGYKSSLRVIESLDIELRARETLVAPPTFFESQDLKIASLNVAEATQFELQPGSMQTFEAIVQVPNTVAPSILSSLGRHAHYLRAKARLVSLETSQSRSAPDDVPTKSTWMSKKLPSLARTRKLEAKEDVYIITVPDNDDRLEYARTHRTSVEHVGPIIARVQTNSLTIGSYVRLGLSVPAPAPGLQLRRVVWNVVQELEIRSRRNDVVHRPQPQRTNLLTVEGDELQRHLIDSTESSSESAMSLFGNWVARLPTDETLIPSTLDKSTDAHMRVTHRIELRITFQTASSISASGPNKDRAVFNVSWPITLASCMCKAHSVILPSYSAKDPLEVGDAAAAMASMVKQRAAAMCEWRRNASSTDHMHMYCTCGTDLAMLLEQEAEADLMYGRRDAASLVTSELAPSGEASLRRASMASASSSAAAASLSRDRADSTFSHLSLTASSTQEEEEQAEHAQRIAEKAQHEYSRA